MYSESKATARTLAHDIPVMRKVVAAILTNSEHIALFQRSHQVQGDRGLWHCITGFLSQDTDPVSQAAREIYEEASIDAEALALINRQVLYLNDAQGNVWEVHAFHYESDSRDIATNWENDQAEWMALDDINRAPTSTWLENVIAALDIRSYFREVPNGFTGDA